MDAGRPGDEAPEEAGPPCRPGGAGDRAITSQPSASWRLNQSQTRQVRGHGAGKKTRGPSSSPPLRSAYGRPQDGSPLFKPGRDNISVITGRANVPDFP